MLAFTVKQSMNDMKVMLFVEQLSNMRDWDGGNKWTAYDSDVTRLSWNNCLIISWVPSEWGCATDYELQKSQVKSKSKVIQASQATGINMTIMQYYLKGIILKHDFAPKTPLRKASNQEVEDVIHGPITMLHQLPHVKHAASIASC